MKQRNNDCKSTARYGILFAQHFILRSEIWLAGEDRSGIFFDRAMPLAEKQDNNER